MQLKFKEIQEISIYFKKFRKTGKLGSFEAEETLETGGNNKEIENLFMLRLKIYSVPIANFTVHFFRKRE